MTREEFAAAVHVEITERCGRYGITGKSIIGK